MLRRHSRVGEAAARRRKAGGKLAVGRRSATQDEWRAIVEQVRARAGDRCEIATHDHPGCDPHHVKPRSLGGEDSAGNVIWICRFHHEQVDFPFKKGRLVIVPTTAGRFAWRIVYAENKWVAPQVVA